MEDTLKDLLDAEAEAEKIVTAGERERDQIIQQATNDARALEQQFVDRLPELHASFNAKAEERAEQAIAEIKLRYDERNKELRELAEQHAEEAVESALNLILAEEEQ